MDSSCTRKQKTWFSDNETLLDAAESNLILQSKIYQNWADSNPMLALTNICVIKVTIIGSDNGLTPGRRQPII